MQSLLSSSLMSDNIKIYRTLNFVCCVVSVCVCVCVCEALSLIHHNGEETQTDDVRERYLSIRKKR
jgi:hypothetical protein